MAGCGSEASHWAATDTRWLSPPLGMALLPAYRSFGFPINHRSGNFLAPLSWTRPRMRGRYCRNLNGRGRLNRRFCRQREHPQPDYLRHGDSNMKSKLVLSASLLAALVLGSASHAQDRAGQKFLKEAIEGNLAEVQMGKLAQKNGSSEAVRSFGQM